MHGEITSMDESVIWECDPWMEKSHLWMKVSSVLIIHGCHPRMKATDDEHGQSHNESAMLL